MIEKPIAIVLYFSSELSNNNMQRIVGKQVQSLSLLVCRGGNTKYKI